MTTTEVLKRARLILSKPNAWTKGWYFKDKYGRDISSSKYVIGQENVSFCSAGACMAVRGNQGEDRFDYEQYLEKAIRQLHPKYGDRANYSSVVTVFNDCQERTIEEVLAVFDHAIELAEAAEVQS